MTRPEPWEELVIAEDAYLTKRMAMFEAGAEQQLRLALADAAGAPTALTVLRDAPVELVMDLVDLIFLRATRTHGHVALARQVIARLDPGWLFLALPPLVKERLNAPEADWEDYRRIAEVLKDLDQLVILEQLVALARTSADPDILEVADDYRRW